MLTFSSRIHPTFFICVNEHSSSYIQSNSRTKRDPLLSCTVADKAIICQEVRFLYVIALTGGGRRNHRLPPSPPSARQQHLQILERLEAADVIGYLVI